MNVLVVGSGGREHALCWSLAASPLVEKLYCAPGSGGIAAEAECIGLAADDVRGIVGFCKRTGIDFVVIGPEDPLVAGLADALGDAGIAALGPSAQAAALEGSKGFTKDLCAGAGIPTAAYGRFADPARARAYAAELGAPVVVKADGLAAGKGVRVCADLAEAGAAIASILGGEFGTAGSQVVVEEYLEGEEVSVFALVHGTQVLLLGSAQDHKRVGEGDTGPNTGGMGAFSPAPMFTPALEAKVLETILQPTAAAMAEGGRPYTGVLYAGLMVAAGEPKLLEYNVRFGDPEAQALLPRLRSDLFTLLLACQEGALDRVDVRWSEQAALCVVLAARGYPGTYENGSVIGGLDAAAFLDDALVFHAGTRMDGAAVRANGGRVLGITGLGASLAEARERAYAAVDRIDWPQGFCRRDIGGRAAVR